MSRSSKFVRLEGTQDEWRFRDRVFSGRPDAIARRWDLGRKKPFAALREATRVAGDWMKTHEPIGERAWLVLEYHTPRGRLQEYSWTRGNWGDIEPALAAWKAMEERDKESRKRVRKMRAAEKTKLVDVGAAEKKGKIRIKDVYGEVFEIDAQKIGDFAVHEPLYRAHFGKELSRKKKRGSEGWVVTWVPKGVALGNFPTKARALQMARWFKNPENRATFDRAVKGDQTSVETMRATIRAMKGS